MVKGNDLIWIFSGTSDGNQIAHDLLQKNYCLTVFVASEYGKSVASETLPSSIVRVGRLTQAELCELGISAKPKVVVDATHPYAIEISKNLMGFCENTDIRYVRYERKEEAVTGDNLFFEESIESAAKKAFQLGSRLLLTIGSKDLEPFIQRNENTQIFIRMLPDPELIKALVEKGVAVKSIIAMQGPFSVNLNKTMIEDYKIDCLVTKSSGREGGFPEKITATQELGIPAVIIKRPLLEFPDSFSDQDAIVDFIQNLDT